MGGGVGQREEPTVPSCRHRDLSEPQGELGTCRALWPGLCTLCVNCYWSPREEV